LLVLVVGVGAGVGGYAALNSNSGSDNKGSRASVSSKPNVSEFPRQPFNSRGVRYNKVTDADVARVRQKTEEAKAKQTPASVTIKKGDTLSEIAKANDMSVAQIKAINDIKNVNEIKPGQKIKLKTNNPYENKMSKGGKATKKKK
jgi:LysM repeat protein